LTMYANWFTAKSVIDYYDYGYDLHIENKRPSFNYYYYTKYNLDPKQYEKEQKASLKQSEKAVEVAKEELEKAINNL
jgi:hypothetical protein